MNLGRNHRHLESLAATLGLSTSTVTRYAKGIAPVVWLQRLWNAIGGSGRSADRLKQSEIPPAIWNAIQQSLGGSGATKEAPEERRTGGGGRRTGGRGPGLPTLPATPPGGGSGGDGSNLPAGGFNRSRFNPNYAPPIPGQESESPLSEEILCGEQSSNVFAFQYDYQASTLFVTYWGHKLNSGGVSKGRVRRWRGRSRPQLIGQAGRTISGGGRGGRGARYAYFDVPMRVFERMRRASSKGKFVWDELRVRGTVYGHKYRYSLVQGQVSTQKGVQGVYIPRKATAQGFRTRSVADLGTGRRGFQTSTLPSQNGFSTRTRR